MCVEKNGARGAEECGGSASDSSKFDNFSSPFVERYSMPNELSVAQYEFRCNERTREIVPAIFRVNRLN